MIKKMQYCLGLSFALISSVWATTPVQQLQQKLAKVPEFQAQFVQQAYDFDQKLILQSEGMLALKAPLKFYWHQQTPDELLLVSDGVNVLYYDPFVEQATINSIDAVLTQTPLPLLSSQDPKLWAGWQVSVDAGCYMLTQNQDQAIEMQVCFDEDRLNKLTLLDAQGNLTVMQLTQFSTNPVADKQSQYTPPAGTFIDDQRLQ